MPGMMDTVLNLGMNDVVCTEISRVSENPRFALDTYRRFLEMFGNVVLGIDKQCYDDIMTKIKRKQGVTSDADLNISSLQMVVEEFKAITPFPEDPMEQVNTFSQISFWHAYIYSNIHTICICITYIYIYLYTFIISN